MPGVVLIMCRLITSLWLVATTYTSTHPGSSTFPIASGNPVSIGNYIPNSNNHPVCSNVPNRKQKPNGNHIFNRKCRVIFL
ncbi:hypothetical protein JOM56_011902 [Amanita muscaria]